MGLFRKHEGNEGETPEVKAKDQISQAPDKITAESKEKPTKSWELNPEEKKKHNDWQSEVGKKYSDDRDKLKRPQGDADYKEERQKQLGQDGTEHYR